MMMIIWDPIYTITDRSSKVKWIFFELILTIRKIKSNLFLINHQKYQTGRFYTHDKGLRDSTVVFLVILGGGFIYDRIVSNS